MPSKRISDAMIMPTDEITFEELYKQYFSVICKYAKYKLKNRDENVEDVANEAFLILWKRWDQFDPKCDRNLKTFLYRAARNITYNRNRKEQRLPTVPFDDSIAHEGNENGIAKFTFEEHLKHIRKNLTEEEYFLFEQKVVYNEDTKNIASQLGISTNTLKMRWYRLHMKLKNIY